MLSGSSLGALRELVAVAGICLTCCKKMIHRQYLLAYLGINSQCCYCRCPVDIAKVMDYEKIDRSLRQPLTPVKTPKHDLQQLLMEEKTPLRAADQVRSESHEKKCMAQITQANRMILVQGKDIENQGGSPGAVVVVQVDYCMVSHAIGIVGVIYQVANTGGAWIATVAGLLSSGLKKGNWWIPSNKYVIKYHTNKIANIAPKLEIIRQSILSGEYNNNNSARCTIQEAHQVITEAVSLCSKSKCGCANGDYKLGCCGCIKKGYKCTSACSCNGNCTANQKMVNKFCMLCVRLFLLMNTCHTKHHPSTVNRCINYNLM
jgi:hypothetical protein